MNPRDLLEQMKAEKGPQFSATVGLATSALALAGMIRASGLPDQRQEEMLDAFSTFAGSCLFHLCKALEFEHDDAQAAATLIYAVGRVEIEKKYAAAATKH